MFELRDVRLCDGHDAGFDPFRKRIDAGGTPVGQDLECVGVLPVHHVECQEDLQIGFLRNGAGDCAVFDIGQHVVVSVHGNNLDVSGSTCLMHCDSRTLATVAVRTSDSDDIGGGPEWPADRQSARRTDLLYH